jgi:hypothetical protein
MLNGGNEAFYQFLLDFDLGDFNEHTKPLMTQAKRDLIDLGLSPAERFYRSGRKDCCRCHLCVVHRCSCMRASAAGLT